MASFLMNRTTNCPSFTDACLPCVDVPFYYSYRPALIVGISDNLLALASPIVAYWALSLIFHLFDTSGWRWLEKYRIHESTEVQLRNRVSPAQVVRGVLLQQLLQTSLGLYWMSGAANSTQINHGEKVENIAGTLASAGKWVISAQARQFVLSSQCAHFLYWWGIPIAQFFFAMFFIDTWQYFFHRLMHMNKFLYKQFHSVHHRLYVPYAFGSLYNHPVEGFLLDSLGSALAQSLSCMTTRQAILLFTFATCKTVDDHCGYNFPFDPFQLLSGNNADYHDIHHQIVGIKSNFSQPFFVHWDVLLGTRMTREEVARRKQTRER